ncbi:DUF2505 domain-containing protein [Solimonas sp. K1W22B-7]|uniref:DUF2505 domain-containing protein n=1 Tax=Solimonas sp. K1W22B-7 TaxID=2303331 RepID=UPI000E32FDCE|nr:DUF2505 domain-containing protein [Solimonas sp. K1W22B-7]AXQ28722.1 DUF2505 domain-containing protein [Solimonas sp. K1W22B-7]
MKHASTSRYPAPAEVVMKMFADPAFHTRKLDALGMAGKYEVLEQGVQGDEFFIRIERKVPISLPGMKKGAGESSVAHEERWNTKSRTGKVQVETRGIPVAISCTASVRDEGEGAVVQYDWLIESSLPLVGGTLEKFVVADMNGRAEQETQAGIDQLSNYR